MVPAGLAPPKLKSPGAAVLVDAAPELAALAPPPRLGKRDRPEVAVVAVPAPGEAVEPPKGAAVDAGALPPGLRKPNPPEPEPPEGPDPALAAENMLLAGAPVDTGVDLSPPKLKGFAGVVAEGCDEAGCAEAGVAPRLNAGGLLAGVEDGVVLPRLPNKDGFGVACVPCPPDAPDWAAPPKMFVGAGDGCVGVLLFASAVASLFPKLKRPEPPGVLPNGFAGVELEAAAPKGLVVGVDAVAGFVPNSEGAWELALVPV